MCHWCSDESDASVLAAGDWVKIDLAAHVDGYVASVAHTLVVPPAPDAPPPPPPDGRCGDLLAAAEAARELLLRLVRPGGRSSSVAPALATLASSFGVSLLEGVLMHQTKRFVLDGNKVILAKPSPELRAADVPFEDNEVYILDVVLSTGDGKAKVVDEKQTSVYKRAVDRKQNLKMKAARAVFGDVLARFPTLPFPVRTLAAEAEGGAARVKLGLRECSSAELITAFPVLWEKAGEHVAHFKFTVMLLPSGPDRVTGLPVPPHSSDKAITDEGLLAILAQPVKVDKKAAKAAKKAAAVEGGAPAAPAPPAAPGAAPASAPA